MKRLKWIVKGVNPKERVAGQPYVAEFEMEIASASLDGALKAFRESPFGELFVYSISTRKPKREDLQ